MTYLTQGFVMPGSSSVPVPSGLPDAVTGRLNTTGVNVIQLTFNLLFMVAAAIAVITIILSGIQWIRSGGDPSGVAAARARLMYAVVGLVVIILAFVIVQTVYLSLTGSGTPTPAGPTP